MNKIVIIELRKNLLMQLMEIDNTELTSFKPMNKQYIEEILFNIDTDENGNLAKRFALPVDLMKKINFEEINFDNFDARGFDFTGFYGITINPQTVYKKDLSFANLNGVIINKTFDGVTLYGTETEGYIRHITKDRKI